MAVDAASKQNNNNNEIECLSTTNTRLLVYEKLTVASRPNFTIIHASWRQADKDSWKLATRKTEYTVRRNLQYQPSNPDIKMTSQYTPTLDESLWAVILSYSSTPDLVQVLESNLPILHNAARLTLSNTRALHFSYLVELDPCRNSIHGSSSSSSGKKHDRNEQERHVAKLLDSIQKGEGKLQRIEFSGLRHLVGDQGNWLPRLFSVNNTNCLSRNLTSINFGGCAMLDPRLLHAALVGGEDDIMSAFITPQSTLPLASSTTTEPKAHCPLLYLNFQGCYRIDAQIVMAIAKSPKFRHLRSLGLGGCSQTIADECVHAILLHLQELRFLDLSGLKRITERQITELETLAPIFLESLELAGCELLRFNSLRQWSRTHLPRRVGYETNASTSLPLSAIVDPAQCTRNYWETQIPWREINSNSNNSNNNNNNNSSSKPMKKLSRLNFNGIGTPRRGLMEGALPYFALRSMGALSEVYLSGCEQVQDWEIDVLARVCANSLNVLEMRACCIGDDAVRAVGLHCMNLSDVDFSACFQITDEGILSFCQYQGIHEDVYSTVKRRRHNATSTVRSFNIGAVPQVSNKSITAISALDSLIFLDVSNCPKVTPDTLSGTVKDLASLVEVNAKGIGRWSSSVAALYCYEDDEPRHLRFVNGRLLRRPTFDQTCSKLCTVRQHSKHLGQSVPLQAMYHCLQCRIIPSLNRGMCHACSIHCHANETHTTYLGSFTRFYCDCPFGVAGSKFQCQAICHRTQTSTLTAPADSGATPMEIAT